MRVDIEISSEVQQPYAIIYTAEVTKEIQDAVIAMEGNYHVITASDHDKIVILNPDEIYMARVENEQVVFYGEKRQYLSNKRLYQVAAQLGKDFIQISRFTIINLKCIDSVRPCFNGLMQIFLKNGVTDYISRKYLPSFKEYLGL